MFKFKDRIVYISKNNFRDAFKVDTSTIETKVYQMKKEWTLLFHNYLVDVKGF
jgi:hypothetical protein